MDLTEGGLEKQTEEDATMMKMPRHKEGQLLEDVHHEGPYGEQQQLSGTETPYGFGSLEDLRHVGDDIEPEVPEEEEFTGFEELYPDADSAAEVGAMSGGPRTEARPAAESQTNLQQPDPALLMRKRQNIEAHEGEKDGSTKADEEEFLEEKYPNPPMTILHIHAGNIGHLLDAMPVVRRVVGLFVEMPLDHLSDAEWSRFKEFFKHFRFDALSEIVLAFQGANAQILSLLLEVLPDQIPLRQLALIESRVDGHNQEHFADLMARAYQPFNLSFIYRGGRVPQVLGLMGSLTPRTQEKVQAVEWRADHTNPRAFRHLGFVLKAFNERTGSAVQTGF